MCGIVAFIELKAQECECLDSGHTSVLQSQLDASLDSVQHRGPDARGTWIEESNCVGLGHVRLSINDLSASGDQPFHHQEDGIHAVVNGELYDHEPIRESLSSEFTFQGQSDCEIVIALYRHYGLSFVSHLRGEFAIVLWDAKRQLLLATRDRFGIKSLYWTVVDGRLLIATEMKSFLAFGWQPEWSVRSIKEQGWLFDDRTYFQGVSKVLPGEYLVSRHFGTIERDRYWDASYPDKTALDHRDEDEIVAGVRQRLLEAVKLRMRADVPVGVYLSGGLDSSTIAGMVKHLMYENENKAKLKCFTVQWDSDEVDESAISRRTAQALDAELHPVAMTEEMIAARFHEAVWYSETVLPDVNGISKLYLAELAKSQGIRAVITGEGSDEHFAGYPFFITDMVDEPDQSWPDSSFPSDPEFRKSIISQFKKWGYFETYDPNSSTAKMLKNTHMVHTMAQLTTPPLAAWTDELQGLHPHVVLAQRLQQCAKETKPEEWHSLHLTKYFWLQSILPVFILRWIGDNVDMVHQVESRPAFLDHHLTEYVNRIPPSLKMKYDPDTGSFTEKYVLRQAARPFITDEIYKRKKQPFVGPVKWSPGGPLHKLLRQLVTEDNISQLGFVDWKKADQAVHRAFEDQDPIAFKTAMLVAQFVVLMQTFKVKPARLCSASRARDIWVRLKGLVKRFISKLY